MVKEKEAAGGSGAARDSSVVDAGDSSSPDKSSPKRRKTPSKRNFREMVDEVREIFDEVGKKLRPCRDF